EVRGDAEADQRSDGEHVQGARDGERAGDAEARRDRAEAATAIEGDVLRGIDDVEAGDPRGDREAEQERCQAEAGADGDPGAGGGDGDDDEEEARERKRRRAGAPRERGGTDGKRQREDGVRQRDQFRVAGGPLTDRAHANLLTGASAASCAIHWMAATASRSP